MTNEGSIFDAKNRNLGHCATNSDSGCGHAAMQVGLGSVCHCVHCVLAGAKPTNHTFKSMDTHLHSSKPHQRCKHVRGYVEMPKTLLNVRNPRKSKDATEPTSNIEQATHEHRIWMQRCLNCNKEEITMMLPFC